MTIVFYSPTQSAEAVVKRYAACRHITALPVHRADFGRTVGEICGIARLGGYPAAEQVPALFQMPPLLLFHNFPDLMLDQALTELRTALPGVFDLAAVVTPTNLSWSLMKLAEELKEHASFDGSSDD